MKQYREQTGDKDARWLILCIAILFFIQLLYTLAFLERLHLEDVAESIRSPFWWAAEHTIYNGVASNVGYYRILPAAYRWFGFSLFLAKWLRLALHFFSLIALAELFRRWLGPKKPWFRFSRRAFLPPGFSTTQT